MPAFIAFCMEYFADYFWPCLTFLWACYLWEAYLGHRQRSLYRTVKTVPAELRDCIDQETFNKSRLYQIDRSTYCFYHFLYSQCETTLFLLYGVFPWFWKQGGHLLYYIGYNEDYEILQSISFLLLVMLIGDIMALPWEIYSVFVIEQRHGFNKQTVRFFIWDQLKGFLVQIVLIPPIISGLIFCIQWGGEYFYFYTWLFVFIVTMVMATVYPNFIQPLFDTYTPLPSGDLRTAIEQLAASLRFPLKKLFVVDGSKRSNHSNAYFYGFWNNKRIVLFDTLLDAKLRQEVEDSIAANKKEKSSEEQQQEGKQPDDKGGSKNEAPSEEKPDNEEIPSFEDKKNSEGTEAVSKEQKDDDKTKKQGCDQEEILAVLGHELGHWKLNHTIQHLMISQVNMFLMLYFFGYFMRQDLVYTSFGFYDGHPTMIGLFLVFQFIFSPYSQVLTFLVIQLTRRFEYQADQFAADLDKADTLQSALTKLNKDNLSFPIADPLYSMFHHSHPTFLERVRALAATKKRD